MLNFYKVKNMYKQTKSTKHRLISKGYQFNYTLRNMFTNSNFNSNKEE